MEPDDLTARELEVYRLVIRGQSNSDIASTLYIAETTVKSHIGSILRKLGARSRTEVVARALETAAHAPTPKGAISRLSPRRLGVLACAAIALAVGIGSVGAAAGAAPEELPEFALPQTDEDKAPNAAPSHVDATSTRFVATVDGLNIYIANQSNSDGVCLITVTHDSGKHAATGCASTTDGGTVFAIGNGLSLLLGQRGSLVIPGDSIRLSESVVAYRID